MRNDGSHSGSADRSPVERRRGGSGSVEGRAAVDPETAPSSVVGDSTVGVAMESIADGWDGRSAATDSVAVAGTAGPTGVTDR